MAKENNQKLTSVGLVSYYRQLGRGERVKLLNYVAITFGKSSDVIRNRFVGRKAFEPAELLALESIIKRELWKL